MVIVIYTQTKLLDFLDINDNSRVIADDLPASKLEIGVPHAVE